MNKIRWGILGCGAFGQRAVAPAIAKAAGGELVSIQRRRVNLARKTALELGLKHFCVDERQMLAEDLVDAVFIASPNAIHAPQTLLAAKYGKHVLVEKPMSLNATEGRKMIAACSRADVKLMVGQCSRFYAQTVKARELVERGKLGKIKAVYLSFTFVGKLADRSWLLERKLAGGGPLMDLGVHLLDNLCFVLNDRVKTVSAWMQPRRGKVSVEKECALRLRMNKGTVAQLYCSYTSPGSHHYRFLGTKGELAMQLREGAPLDLFCDYRLKQLTVPRYDHVRAEVEAFNRHLLGKGPNPVPGKDGLRNMQVIDAAYRSAKTGREEKID